MPTRLLTPRDFNPLHKGPTMWQHLHPSAKTWAPLRYTPAPQKAAASRQAAGKGAGTQRKEITFSRQQAKGKFEAITQSPSPDLWPLRAGFHLWKTINSFLQGSKLQALRIPAISTQQDTGTEGMPSALNFKSRFPEIKTNQSWHWQERGAVSSQGSSDGRCPLGTHLTKGPLWWEQLFDSWMSLAEQGLWACFPSPGSPIALGWLVGDTSSPATVQRLTTQTTKDRFPEWGEQD